ncbi:MAG: carbon-nitrogen hydrolase family protein [Prosthecobacter sp.]|jgi:predicted amidohydrolase|nr:carbon-nitrogen hydrolase family protein [Prosthecobacter sp.]
MFVLPFMRIHIVLSLFFTASLHAADFHGWACESPRDEIRPQFSSSGENTLIITHDAREGLDGWFQKSFEVKGGTFYRFEARRRTTGVTNLRQSCLVRVLWQDEKGNGVKLDAAPEYLTPGLPMPSAEPEYPADGQTDAEGWATVSGVYRAPSKAAKAIVELHLQWAPGGRVEWRGAHLATTEPPAPRKVRLATIHHKPNGKSPRENCAEFAPLLTEAAQKHADLVVLGETVPTASAEVKSLKIQETAEPIPGPSTTYFAGLAKQHRLHVVLSLYERDAHLIYNTAVLLGPDGTLIGKYRKVSLPPGEAAKGIAPGKDYPVFDTAFGKVGMMVCYDGFFPEVARELTKNGAEVIAWPVWGCNPLLAQARACENHVFVISSTFMKPDDGWMYSAIYDQGGRPLAKGEQWGTVVVTEVDLNQPYYGPYNLGDFHSMIARHRPPVPTGK